MWIVVVVVVVLLILSWLNAQINFMGDFFDANIFTLLALISAVIAAIYFWASSKSYKDYKIKDKILKLFEGISDSDNLSGDNTKTSINSSSSTEDKLVKLNESLNNFDLSNNSIKNLYDKLFSTINAPEPMFLYFKGRRNDNVILENRYQALILEKIKGLLEVSKAYADLKADAIVSADYLDKLVQNKKEEANLIFKAALKRQEALISDSEKIIKINESEVDNQKAQNEATRADSAIKMATARKIEAEARASEKKIEIIEKLLAEADFNNLTIHQTFLLHTFLGADPSQFSEFQIKEELKDIIKQEKQADANRKDAEADNAKTEAQSKKWKDEKAQKDAGL
jgi:hypothetical protein